jgi:thiol-disulfide isomerase/thioredoxin
MYRYLLIYFIYYPLLFQNGLFAQVRPSLMESPDYFRAKVSSVLIKGMVTNIPDTVKHNQDLMEASFYTLDAEGKSLQPIRINSDGSFEITVPYTVSLQQLYLSIGEDYIKRLYVAKGLILQIDYSKIDHKEQNPLIFSGEDKALNEYVNEYYAERDQFNRKFSFDQAVQTLTSQKISQEVFLNRIVQLQKGLDSLNANFIKNHSSNSFKWIILNEAEGLYYANILQFYWTNALTLSPALWKRISSYKTGFLGNASDLFYHYLHYYMANQWENTQQLPLDSIIRTVITKGKIRDKKKVTFLKNTASLYTAYQQARIKGTNFSEHEHTLNSHLAVFNKDYFSSFKAEIEGWINLNSISLWSYLVREFPGKRGEILLARSLPRASQLPPSKFREEYEKVVPLIHSEDVLFFTNYYLQKTNKVPSDIQQVTPEENAGSPGNYSLHQLKLAPETQLNYNLSINGLTILKQLRETHQGKVLFIDFWATWCSPCFEDFEESVLLKNRVDKTKIVFIYLCNDSKIEDWKERILEKKLKGTHLFLTAKQSKDIMKKFNFHGYPSYLLIDRAGKISYDVRWMIHEPEKGAAFLNKLAHIEKPD